MEKLHISVLMGGPSLEHAVSLVSGTGITRALDPERYEVYPLVISQEGIWVWSTEPLSPQEKAEFDPDTFALAPDRIKKNTPHALDLPGRDLVFLGLHGSFGEDGKVQAWLELAGIPYTGSGLLGSALALDKIKAKCIYQAYGIPTAPWREISQDEFYQHGIAPLQKQLPFPWFCKDPVGGSSIAMGKAENELEAMKLMAELFQKAPTLLVESCLTGTEVSCGWIDGVGACPATEICVEGYFDFDAKYKGKSEEITPARISPEQMSEVQKLAQRCHQVLGLDVYSRTDMILDPRGIFVLETNTLPGFTPTSLLPQQAAHMGISYAQLLDIVIQTSLKVRR